MEAEGKAFLNLVAGKINFETHEVFKRCLFNTFLSVIADSTPEPPLLNTSPPPQTYKHSPHCPGYIQTLKSVV